MFRKSLFAIILLLASLVPATVFAGGFCCQVSTGTQKGFNSKGDISLGVDYSYSLMSRIQEGGNQISMSELMDDPRFRKMRGSLPDKMYMHRTTLSAAYSPIDRLTVGVSVPYVINDMTMFGWMAGDWRWMRMDRIEGLGDIVVNAQYRVYQDNPDQPKTSVTLGVGVKTPTGSSSRSGANGSRTHAHMQPGTGSWDTIIMGNVSKVVSPKFLITADARYQFATANALGYKFGDTASVGVSGKYNATNYLNLGVGLDYFHSGKSTDPSNKYNGQVVQRLTDYVGYTGEDSLWISPEIQILPFNGASVNLKFQYPLVYNVPLIEQVADYRLNLSVGYAF